MDPGGEVHELWVGDDRVRIERIDVLVERFVRLLRRGSHLLIDLILLSSRGGLLVEFLLFHHLWVGYFSVPCIKQVLVYLGV